MPRKNETNKSKSQHPILDGIAYIYKRESSGDVWQFRMYVSNEHRDYRVSLRTRDFESAVEKGRNLAIELSSQVSRGMKVFGISLGELVNEYLEYRHNDVMVGDIVVGRWTTMKSQLKHLLELKGRDIKLSELERECLYDYAQLRRLNNPNVALVTLRNEQATINAMIGYGYRKNYIHFEKLTFKAIRIRRDQVGTRDSFTLEEYDNLVRHLRTYVSKKECPNDDEREERLMIRDYILISSNTCGRVGELRQLLWGDVKRIEHTFDEIERPTTLVHLTIRAETSKNRATRKLITRGGEYFVRLKKRSPNTEPHHLIFSNDGVKPLPDRKWSKHWYALMDGIGIDNHKERKLEWYSLRHFGITCRVKANVNLIDLSKLAGTSVNHIENTYLKYSEEQSRTSALKNFIVNRDGTITTTDGLGKPRIDEPEEESDGWEEYDEIIGLD